MLSRLVDFISLPDATRAQFDGFDGKKGLKFVGLFILRAVGNVVGYKITLQHHFRLFLRILKGFFIRFRFGYFRDKDTITLSADYY